MSSTDSNNSNSKSNGNITNDDNNKSWYGIIGAAAAVAAGIGLYMSLKAEKTNEVFESPCSFQTPHKRKIIDVVDTVDKCKRAISKIQEHCRSYNIVGLDCEYLEENQQQTIYLLQIATHEGYCALFRLHLMETIPQCLSDLLKDNKVIKVGVGIYRDTVCLHRDFGLTTKKILDINFFADKMNYGSGTLKMLTDRILNSYIRKNKNLSQSVWKAYEIPKDRIEYAADDAIAGIEIFKKLAIEYCCFFDRRDLQSVLQLLEPHFEKQY